jgi:hypothetical protein
MPALSRLRTLAATHRLSRIDPHPIPRLFTGPLYKQVTFPETITIDLCFTAF